ncbi:hypothetical protein [Jeotgalibaca sp. A122]|uniref:hypothetical protein n=1 Tax=Jeotgalibaca sp. A122 TaxID=3457322 RepID=UPI003FD34A35
MNNHLDGNYSLLAVIVNRTKAQRIIQFAKSLGIKRYTSLHGRGTIPSAILQMLELGEVSKEILLFIVPTIKEKEHIQSFNEKFNFDKRNSGIIFSVTLSHCLGITHKAPEIQLEDTKLTSGVVGVCIVVNKGIGEEIVELTNDDAYFGGTILPAHGSADYSRKIFNLATQDEKETVLMLVPASKVSELKQKLSNNLNLQKANSGILFTFDVNEIHGLFKNRLVESGTNYENSGDQYDAIWAIVPSGKDAAVIASAEKGGSTGGTIFHARGSHVVEHRLFINDIEPEKELVMMIAKREKSYSISKSINEEFRLDDPGTGVLFVFPIGNTTGLFVE